MYHPKLHYKKCFGIFWNGNWNYRSQSWKKSLSQKSYKYCVYLKLNMTLDTDRASRFQRATTPSENCFHVAMRMITDAIMFNIA